ncbi:MAG TPA: hypothetical protein VFX89_01830 [Gammaproteobacteria bacterium]|nr:hypothetical protein [Gammaproteobacteria bacterium]
MIRKLNNVLLAASALVALVAFWHRNDLPAGLAFRDELEAEPRQTVTEERPFSVAYAGVSYKIEPQFDYDLYGLVVSYRLHDGNSTMHRRANDHLNVADLCVVWSDTAFSPTLRKIDFWNGIFTCNFETRDAEAWARFATNQVSNNHLLSADALVRNRVAGVRIGDQIHVRGLLASYTSPGGTRGTSITRNDEGNGACETIFVKDFAVIEPARHGWRLMFYCALAAFAAGVIVHVRAPYRPYGR